MTISVSILWWIYIVTVIITFIIFWMFMEVAQNYYNSVGYGIAFFLASIIGAIAVFIGAAWLDPNDLTNNEKTWLSVLFFISFILPIFVIFYIIWAEEYTSFTESNSTCEQPCYKPCCKPTPCEQPCYKPCCKPTPCEQPCYKPCCKPSPCEQPEAPKVWTEKKVHCDRDTGVCHVKKEITHDGDNVTTVKYSSHK